jgi:hypothetical protein
MLASWLPSASPDIANVDVAVVGAVFTVFGYFIRAYLDRNKQFSSANGSIKRKMYRSFIDKMMGTTAKFKKQLNALEIETIKNEFGQSAQEFYKTSILFASPNVVRAYADFARSDSAKKVVGEKPEYELMLRTARLYKAMRKDIGLSNRRLGRDGELLLRGNITDYDGTIAKYASTWQRMIRFWKRTW